MCPPVKWGWCLKSFKRRYTFFIFFMFKMNSLMVLEYFDNGLFYDKISFSSEKTRRGLENVWRNWSTIESNFAKTTSPVEAYVHVYYRNI